MNQESQTAELHGGVNTRDARLQALVSKMQETAREMRPAGVSDLIFFNKFFDAIERLETDEQRKDMSYELLCAWRIAPRPTNRIMTYDELQALYDKMHYTAREMFASSKTEDDFQDVFTPTILDIENKSTEQAAKVVRVMILAWNRAVRLLGSERSNTEPVVEAQAELEEIEESRYLEAWIEAQTAVRAGMEAAAQARARAVAWTVERAEAHATARAYQERNVARHRARSAAQAAARAAARARARAILDECEAALLAEAREIEVREETAPATISRECRDFGYVIFDSAGEMAINNAPKAEYIRELDKILPRYNEKIEIYYLESMRDMAWDHYTGAYEGPAAKRRRF